MQQEIPEKRRASIRGLWEITDTEQCTHALSMLGKKKDFVDSVLSWMYCIHANKYADGSSGTHTHGRSGRGTKTGTNLMAHFQVFPPLAWLHHYRARSEITTKEVTFTSTWFQDKVSNSLHLEGRYAGTSAHLLYFHKGTRKTDPSCKMWAQSFSVGLNGLRLQWKLIGSTRRPP